VQPAQLEAPRGHRLERALDVLQVEPELGVDLPGGDVVVRRRLDAGRDAQHHLLGRLDQVDLVEGIEDDVADARLLRVLDLRARLVVAVEVELLGREAAS
jgi:hypothetical protein